MPLYLLVKDKNTEKINAQNVVWLCKDKTADSIVVIIFTIYKFPKAFLFKKLAQKSICILHEYVQFIIVLYMIR